LLRHAHRIRMHTQYHERYIPNSAPLPFPAQVVYMLLPNQLSLLVFQSNLDSRDTVPIKRLIMSPPVKIVFGTGSVGDRLTGATAQEAFDLFRKHGHVEIDTAAAYPPPNPGAGEVEIGKVHPDWAQISTKVLPGVERANSREKLQQSLGTSLEKLDGLDVDIYYFHSPDAATPMEEQAAAMDEAHKAGKFRRFGISNFAPEQVEELVEIAERKGE
jgi:aflatoxin B1 aldehyde reductase